MNISQVIKNKLTIKFSPSYLNIDDVSYLHANHKEMLNANSRLSSETHFNLLIVSEKFKDLPLLARHRLINSMLQEEFANGLHALAIKAYTKDEYLKI